jgi:FlaA1/EpsC-like NDP-sugar epimerase
MVTTVRNRYVLLSDALAFVGAPFLSYVLRFEGILWSPADTATLLVYTAVAVPFKLLLLFATGLYNRLWAQAGARDLVWILRVATVCGFFCFALGAAILPSAGLTPSRVPLSVLALDALVTLAAICIPRTAAKLIAARVPSRVARAEDHPTLIVGAGAAGRLVADELLSNPQLGLRLIGFADDDPAKQDQLLRDLPVLGALADIPDILDSHHVREMIIAMPRARGSVVRNLVRVAHEAGVHTRTVPGLFEIISQRVNVSALREVEIQDLLRREPVLTDLAGVGRQIAGRTVLVTGAGGSIGSELCRQLARLGPSRLLLLGHGENSIFEILNEMAARHPELPTTPLIVDVRDTAGMGHVFQRHRPDVVFHAAAHKHVPLMEGNIAEAILNNVLGTATVVEAALRSDTERLVLVSSDKAVRPSSVMGATKRAAELVVQTAGMMHDREYVAVRFGNVLGSRGSVVPTFLRQIRAGGPVIVTHPEMRRYFMTIPEAVQLLLQAGALGHRGEVFMLDMGEPVRIVDLAEDLIRLSGLQPHEDIEIRFSGVRPGERLAEELVLLGESVVGTEHPKVLRATNGHLADWTGEAISQLILAAQQQKPDAWLRGLLTELVPEATFATTPPPLYAPGASTPTPAPTRPRHAAGGVGARG